MITKRGYNKYGQLGLGDCVDMPYPKQIKHFSNDEITFISSGDNHMAALSRSSSPPLLFY